MERNVILITGATSGIGMATTETLLNEGYIIYALGRDTLKLQNKFGTEFQNELRCYSSDLRNISDLEGLFNTFTANGEKLTGMVLCAGIEETIPLVLYTSDKIKNIFDVNVFASIELIRIFSKKKHSEDMSSIVLLSSVMGILGQSGKVGYCASKAALLGLVKSSALELAKRKIRVNAILPGIVNTPMSERLFTDLDELNISRIKEMHPLGFGEVSDIVPAIKFLLSDDSRWMTGQILIIDGGYSIS